MFDDENLKILLSGIGRWNFGSFDSGENRYVLEVRFAEDIKIYGATAQLHCLFEMAA